jgi:hypothetical protein
MCYDTRNVISLEVARIGDSEPRSSWTFAGSTEAYPRDDEALRHWWTEAG